MKSSLLVLWVVLTSALTVCAEEPNQPSKVAIPNAAGIYWQAFSAMPDLNEQSRKTLEAATASTSAPLTDDLKPIVAQYRVALHELHRARAVKPCDWQLDTDAGPELRLPHLQKGRDLSRIALLRARQRFAAGEVDAAVSDVVAVLKMGRDCGSSEILISFLVTAAIEKSANDVLAMHLPLLNKEQLTQLETTLKELPAACHVSSTIRAEERLFGAWLERKIDEEVTKLNDPQAGGQLLMAIAVAAGLESDFRPDSNDKDGQRKAEFLKSLTVAEVRESLAQMHADYAEVVRISALSFDLRHSQIAALDESLTAAGKVMNRDDAKRYLSVSFMPTVRNVLLREEQYLVRRQLLEQAIRVQRDGADSLQPIFERKVDYQKTKAGFELRCRCGNESATITVGNPS